MHDISLAFSASQKPFTIKAANAEETKQMGRLFSSALQEGAVIVLTGDLGVGKTVFVQGVAEGLGVTDEVVSPTFNIMHVYEPPSGPLQALYHFDLYRIEDVAELGETGLLDVAGIEGASFIEWGEAYTDVLGDDYCLIKISRKNDDGRELEFYSFGEQSKKIIEAFRATVSQNS